MMLDWLSSDCGLTIMKENDGSVMKVVRQCIFVRLLGAARARWVVRSNRQKSSKTRIMTPRGGPHNLKSICQALSNVALDRVIIKMMIKHTMNYVEARDLHGNESMQKNKKATHSKLLLHELGFDESKLEEYRRRFLNVGSDRVVPGGPDSHHHSQPPF
ncbi:hypothetical protein LguiB_002261 [Lonicera macranthoides]